MKPRVWKHPTKNFWCVSHGPHNRVIMPYINWEEALDWANQYANRYTQEPTC